MLGFFLDHVTKIALPSSTYKQVTVQRAGGNLVLRAQWIILSKELHLVGLLKKRHGILYTSPPLGSVLSPCIHIPFWELCQ